MIEEEEIDARAYLILALTPARKVEEKKQTAGKNKSPHPTEETGKPFTHSTIALLKKGYVRKLAPIAECYREKLESYGSN